MSWRVLLALRRSGAIERSDTQLKSYVRDLAYGAGRLARSGQLDVSSDLYLLRLSYLLLGADDLDRLLEGF